MVKRENKKGAEFTITTLIVIILAIVVLVVLMLGFGTGWANLWGKMSGYFTTANVDSVKEGCKLACTTNGVYSYCNQIRDVVTIDAQGNKDSATYKGQTCKTLETKGLGFEACPSIDCGSSATQNKVYTNSEAVNLCNTEYTAAETPTAKLAVCNSVKQVLKDDQTTSSLSCKTLVPTLVC